ncbi:Copper chaperone CopZ [Pseudarcicella hirudinis]|uniref:Copper chaperone CopZ n=1 Tax=Pseudarcicella hirudinis TaxID=1079859 RepID=A0A1I5MIE6_9BACT|nr:heavy metal-associated domain-containing protein [Pseudarcicella hirudinis]SFP09418.1 Copper chaperone CopZ [Pseudarcicella hirudinis]
METIKFKTDINCSGCVSKVSPLLNQLDNIENWKVDLENPDKILTVESEEKIDTPQLIETLEKAGFNAEVI